MPKQHSFFSGTAMALLGLAYGGRAYAASCNISLSYTKTIETCTTSDAGTYRFSLFGAEGGSGTFYSAYARGGLGAQVVGDIFLPANTTLQLLVGGMGSSGRYGGGGGGGSFVASGATPVSSTALAVAGGGGGGSMYYDGVVGDRGDDGTAENTGNAGGRTADYSLSSGGGGGFASNGTNPTYAFNYGFAFVNGGSGGRNSFDAWSAGGFGGGGASYDGGGGGGGYSGGDGNAFYEGGGGGGSFLIDFAENRSLTGGVNSGNGSIDIERLTPLTPVPLPGGAGLLAAGIAALGGAGALRRRARKPMSD